MPNKPLVSFLIPYFNHKQYISLTLDSILNDTYPNKEIVIINDGSTDTDISLSMTGLKGTLTLYQLTLYLEKIKALPGHLMS